MPCGLQLIKQTKQTFFFENLAIALSSVVGSPGTLNVGIPERHFSCESLSPVHSVYAVLLE